MKFISLTMTFLFFASTSFAQQESISYKCSPSKLNSDTSLSAGSQGEISKIKDLIIPNSHGSNISMLVEGLTMSEMMNNKNIPTEKLLKYSVKDMKSGTLVELENDYNNDFQIDAIFLEFGKIDVATAGPLPEGTFHQVISMAFVDSNTFYTNSSPMTVKKIIFDCQTTVKY